MVAAAHGNATGVTSVSLRELGASTVRGGSGFRLCSSTSAMKNRIVSVRTNGATTVIEEKFRRAGTARLVNSRECPTTFAPIFPADHSFSQP